MIREIAIEPKLLIEWAAKPAVYSSLLRDGFGLGQPRILSHYPADWKQRVLDLMKVEWSRLEAAAQTDVEKGRLLTQQKKFDILLQRLVEVSVDRKGLTYERQREWLINALAHWPEPIQAILSTETPGAPDHVLAGDDFFDNPHWKCDKSRLVQRDKLADAVAPLLARCSQVIFVDPYFGPGSDNHIDAFKGFLGALINRSPMPAPRRIEILTCNRKGSTWDFFEKGCKKRVEPLLPFGWRVRILWLKERQGGEDLHNRYILTELAGVWFGKGLDSGAETTADDVGLMSREQHDKRWEQYAGSPKAFELDPEGKVLLLEGRAKPLSRVGSTRER